MRCPNCGREIPKGEVFYTCSCGKRIKVISKEEARRKDDEARIKHADSLRNGKQYGSANCKCCYCNYSGPMQILQYEKGVFCRIILPLIIVCGAIALSTLFIASSAVSSFISCLLFLGGGGLAWFVHDRNNGKTLLCPQCKNVLQTIVRKNL